MAASGLPLGPPPDAEEYPVNHSRRGKAIIFNNTKFTGKNNEIKGTEKDISRLRTELESLGFEIDVQSDLKVKEIEEKLAEASKKNYDDESCLIVIVMSHGGRLQPQGFGKEFSCQKIAAKDGTYNEEDLFLHFEGGRCSSLVSKPKIFLVEACRGPEDPDKIPRSKYEIAMKDRVTELVTFTLPYSSDFLVFRATVDGTSSEYDENTGSYFIQTLCDELEINRTKRGKNPLDLESLLVNVKRNFVNKYKTSSQMPCVYSTLIRKLYLNPVQNIE